MPRYDAYTTTKLAVYLLQPLDGNAVNLFFFVRISNHLLYAIVETRLLISQSHRARHIITGSRAVRCLDPNSQYFAWTEWSALLF